MLNVIRQRNFGLLWFGQLISLVGDWVLFIALPFYIYELTGSTLATGAMFIASALPRLFFGSVAGVFVDRWDRKKTMIVADVLRAGLLLVLLFVRSAEWVWVIYAVAFVSSTISQFFVPAKSAIIPNLVSKDDLMTANSLNAMSDSLTRLVGPALGGALMAGFGLTSVILIDSVSFLVSAVMIALVTVTSKATAHTESLAKEVESIEAKIWSEWLAGLRVVKTVRILFTLFVIFGVMTFGDSLITALIVPMVKQVMGGDAAQLGWVMTAQGFGGLIGGLVIAQYGKRWSPTWIISSVLVIVGLLSAVAFNFPSFWIVTAMLLGIGLFIPAMVISAETLLQTHTQDEFRGRVFGALMTTMALASLVGMGLASVWGDRLGIVNVLNFAAAMYVASGVLAFVMLQSQSLQAQPSPVVAE